MKTPLSLKIVAVLFLLIQIACANFAEEKSSGDSSSDISNEISNETGGRNYFSPWPLPIPTSKIEINKENFQMCTSLGSVDDVLRKHLVKNDYEMGYYYVPFEVPTDSISELPNHGFVLATKLEHINEEGFPENPDRWIASPREKEGGFWDLLKEIFIPEPGHFRVILFVVTDLENITRKDGIPFPKEDALNAVRQGEASLFREIANTKYDPERFKVWAFIYQYEVDANSEGELSPIVQSKVSARDHLLHSNINFEL